MASSVIDDLCFSIKNLEKEVSLLKREQVQWQQKKHEAILALEHSNDEKEQMPTSDTNLNPEQKHLYDQILPLLQDNFCTQAEIQNLEKQVKLIYAKNEKQQVLQAFSAGKESSTKELYCITQQWYRDLQREKHISLPPEEGNLQCNLVCYDVRVHTTAPKPNTRHPQTSKRLLTFCTRYKGYCQEIQIEEVLQAGDPCGELARVWSSVHLQGLENKVKQCIDTRASGRKMVEDAVWYCIDKELAALAKYKPST